jgi:hypothetical protein
MGHRYGAWAIFAWAAEPDSWLRAFLTLDSGFEYDSVEASGVESLLVRRMRIGSKYQRDTAPIATRTRCVPSSDSRRCNGHELLLSTW